MRNQTQWYEDAGRWKRESEQESQTQVPSAVQQAPWLRKEGVAKVMGPSQDSEDFQVHVPPKDWNSQQCGGIMPAKQNVSAG